MIQTDKIKKKNYSINRMYVKITKGRNKGKYKVCTCYPISVRRLIRELQLLDFRDKKDKACYCINGLSRVNRHEERMMFRSVILSRLRDLGFYSRLELDLCMIVGSVNKSKHL
jgi:hypothetical protein